MVTIFAAMERRRITIHGQEIAYVAAGSGPSVLLIHGMAGSSSVWRHVIPGLAEHYTVIAPDLLGHGESDKPRADYSLGAYATGLRDLLIALDIARATIVGQSFGGGVAMQFAYQYPERCERVVLVDSGGLGNEVHPILCALSVPGAEWLLPIGCAPALRHIGDSLVRWLERRGWRPGPVTTEIGRSYASLADTQARRAFLHTLRSVVDHIGQRVSARDKLYLQSELPTLIIWGTRDRTIPVEHGIQAHSTIQGSRLELFEGAGHFPHCEQPARFVRVVHDFILSTRPATLSHARLRSLLARRDASRAFDVISPPTIIA